MGLPPKGSAFASRQCLLRQCFCIVALPSKGPAFSLRLRSSPSRVRRRRRPARLTAAAWRLGAGGQTGRCPLSPHRHVSPPCHRTATWHRHVSTHRHVSPPRAIAAAHQPPPPPPDVHSNQPARPTGLWRREAALPNKNGRLSLRRATVSATGDTNWSHTAAPRRLCCPTARGPPPTPPPSSG